MRSQSLGPVGPLVASNGLAEAGLLIGATVGVGAIVLNQTDNTIPTPTIQSQSPATSLSDSSLRLSGDVLDTNASFGFSGPVEVDIQQFSN